jgi:ribosomal protein L22
MEDNKFLNPVVKALNDAKVFLDKVIAEDNAVIDLLNKPEFLVVITLLEKRFPVLSQIKDQAEVVSKYVKNAAANAILLVNDLLDIVNIIEIPFYGEDQAA